MIRSRLLAVGVAYVTFSSNHSAHFAVMFAPDLIDGADPELAAAQQLAFAILRGGVDSLEGVAPSDAAAAVLAGWSLVHGLATLAASGNLDTALLPSFLPKADLPTITRRAAALLYGAPRAAQR